MKKILKTKLQYTCNKYEEFCYIDREYKMVYDRSYTLVITTSTKGECWRVMDSFEEYMRKKGIQDIFDSNLAPSLNQDHLWVGTVELYVSNDDVEKQKEIIEDAYKEWEENLRTSSANSVEKKIEELKRIKQFEIKYIVETNFGDDTSWIVYSVGDKIGYELTEYGCSKEEVQQEIDCSYEKLVKLIRKNSILKCSDYLRGIIEECSRSDNEMWFVEFDELEKMLSNSDDDIKRFINRIAEEVESLGIEDYIKFYEDDCAITVYGGVATQFLF